MRGINAVDRYMAIDGSIASPAFTFIDDPDTGLYRQGANIFGAVVNGIEQWRQADGLLTFQKKTTIGVAGTAQNTLARVYGITVDQVFYASSPAVAINPAVGVLNGGYKYSITFVTAEGETFVNTFSAQVNPVLQQVDLTNIPTSADTRVTARRIYRTTVGGSIASTLSLVTTINDNITTIYTDNTLDGALGVKAPCRDTTGGMEIFSALGGLHMALSGFTCFGRHDQPPVVTGLYNAAFGHNALGNLTTGYDNCAFGTACLSTLTTGHDNTCMGDGAGQFATTLQTYVGIGSHAGYGNPLTADRSTVVGAEAGRQLTSGVDNVMIGYSGAWNLTSGKQNVVIGSGAGYNLTIEDDNVIIGYQAAPTLAAAQNVIIGKSSATVATTAIGNTVVGYTSGTGLSTGDYNVLIGFTCGNDLTTGLRNIIIGPNTMSAVGAGGGTSYKFWVDSIGDTIANTYLYGEMDATQVERYLYLGSGVSAAGTTLKDVALYLRDHYWNAADVVWDAKILHNMVTAGAAPKSSLDFLINGVLILRLQNNNGTPNVDFTNAGNQLQGPSIAVDGTIYLRSNEDNAQSVDRVKLSGYDIAAGRRTLDLAVEENVAVDVGLVSANSLSVRINGVTYKIMLV